MLPGVRRALAAPEPSSSLSIAIVLDPADPVASAAPSRWAAAELLARLQARKIESRIVPSLSQTTAAETRVLVCGPALAAPAVLPVTSRPPAAQESFCLSSATIAGRKTVIASGRDPRGVTYAVLELADRLDLETNPEAAFQQPRPLTEQPANRLRGVLRAFVSEVEDKPWYYDRGAWRDYLTMLVTHRFNRFNLSFGIGYDFVTDIRDSYFHFTYPFLLNVPGYNVQVTITPPFGGKPDLLTDDERSRNLSLLQYISAAAAERGLDFQLGLWTHAWNFDTAAAPSHRITGLNATNHAAYCRDALKALLIACPAISGVTLRTHGESGVPEESYGFWKEVFSGIAGAGRKIEIDQHAKGIDAQMISLAHETGMPTAVSPKYWAEHMGLPYHQAAIRPTEMPKPGARDAKGALMALSNGSRSFLRYGYGDLLRDDRKHAVLHRIWPGTQRLLIWGDPLMAAAYGRCSGFSGSDGVEWMEPLTFKGRKGSGLAGGRNGYAGVTPFSVRDWEKYLYTYRVWGRGIYNPSAGPDARRRYLARTLGRAADSLEAALSLSSRILPTITTAHMPSAANNNYWPEMYTNQSIVVENAKDPYSDTPSPRRFGTTSPLDSRLFCTVDRCAEQMVKGAPGPEYSPLEVATWLEDLAHDSETNLEAADAAAGTTKTPEHKQWAVDIAIQNGIGKFFAAKFRAAVLYGIYTRSADPAALEEALKSYRSARDAWKALVATAGNVYRPDITFGYVAHLRGTWRDRMAAIEQDIAAMEAAKLDMPATPATAAIVAALAVARRQTVALKHTPVKRFRAGAPVVIEAALPATTPGKLNLVYRRVNQSENWVSVPMQPTANGYSATIPQSYAASPYPLQYYFEVLPDSGNPTMYPGLARDYSTQPYYLVRRG